MNPSQSGSIYQYRKKYRVYKILLLTTLAVLLLIPISEGSLLTTHKPHTLKQLASVIARKQGMDPNLVKSIISVESSWNPSALSSKGAIGLMQVHHPTWKERWTKKELLDPEKNLFAGTTILKNMLNTSTNLEEALHKYSGGAKDYASKVKRRMSGQV
jgi:soluble lytic murein transglycosylase-like protein